MPLGKRNLDGTSALQILFGMPQYTHHKLTLFPFLCPNSFSLWYESVNSCNMSVMPIWGKNYRRLSAMGYRVGTCVILFTMNCGIHQSRVDLGGGGGGGVLGALKHPPPKFYNEQVRKLLEAVVQVQLYFIHMYGQ